MGLMSLTPPGCQPEFPGMQGFSTTRRLVGTTLALMDGLILLASGLAAAWLRFRGGQFSDELTRILLHPGFIAYAVTAQLLLATTFELYQPENWRSRDYLLLRLAALAITFGVALVLGVYLVMPWRFGRGLLALTLLIALPLEAAIRLAWLALAARPQPRRAVIIGDGPIVESLKDELDRMPSPPFVVDAHLPEARSDELQSVARHGLEGVDFLVVASLGRDAAADTVAGLNFRGITVVDAAGAYAALTGRIPIRQVDSRWFIATGDFSSLARSPFHHVQRFLDIAIATVLLLVTAPILLLSILTILVTAGPPVFFTQTRVGRFGRRFVLFKLRTMRAIAGKAGPRFAEIKDGRVFPAGRLLRRWRIDELPQLINVLRGEMSLVGPRPERPEIAAELEQVIPFYAFRYSVRPGLTGWAQVNLPYVAETEDHAAKLEYDLYLLRHHGPAMYGIVLLRTLGALVFQPGR